jgi:Family of unknown function (DUF6544)
VVTEADLTGHPEPVRRYLRATGVVGQPRVWNYRLRFRGRIRGAPDARWMPFDADQQSFADQPSRLFLMRARMVALPVEAFHRLIGGRATMQVKIAGAIPMVDARGDVMDRSEAVTLFNDMCLLAPGTLLDPGIGWEEVDARTVRARFSNGGHTISARLLFGDDGLLTNFISDDRSRSSPDGKVFTRLRFSTPVRDFATSGPRVSQDTVRRDGRCRRGSSRTGSSTSWMCSTTCGDKVMVQRPHLGSCLCRMTVSDVARAGRTRGTRRGPRRRRGGP